VGGPSSSNWSLSSRIWTSRRHPSEDVKNGRVVPRAVPVQLLDKDSLDQGNLFAAVVAQVVQRHQVVCDVGAKPKDIRLRVEVEGTGVQFRVARSRELPKGMGPRLAADVESHRKQALLKRSIF